jgi:hypothetical protein
VCTKCPKPPGDFKGSTQHLVEHIRLELDKEG